MARDGGYDEAHARRAVFAAALRRSWRGAVLWGLAFGVTIAATEAAYPKTFPTPESRQALQLLMQGNTGFAAVFGQIHRIDTVAGYTVYKTMFTLVILAAIWGLLVATRVLRGEEDVGQVGAVRRRADDAWRCHVADRCRARRRCGAGLDPNRGVRRRGRPGVRCRDLGERVALLRDRGRRGRGDGDGDRHALLAAVRDTTRRQPSRRRRARRRVSDPDGCRLGSVARRPSVGEPDRVDRGARAVDRVAAARLLTDHTADLRSRRWVGVARGTPRPRRERARQPATRHRRARCCSVARRASRSG